jgi:choline dehydrogenase-like flavoprotein
MTLASFDYIIVGAGSAGCVLANRLSEDATRRVLILEAGARDSDMLIHIPLGIGKIAGAQLYNWKYMSAPEPHADNRSIYHPRGKVLGGSSSINMMAYVRGHARDFDRWRQKGCDGWSYAEVLPYFMKSENFETGGDDWHGAGGPLQVKPAANADPIFEAFLKAGATAGYPRTDDYNGAEQEGFATLQQTIGGGKRSSGSSAFLRPAERRSNLKIVTEATVTRIIIEQGRAVGVAYTKGGVATEIRTTGEVILSGGAINSPQLLMLSGIGPGEHLKDHGLDVVCDLPGVGQNLQDHPAIGMNFLRSDVSDLHQHLRFDRLLLAMVRAQLFGTGFAATAPSSVTAFVKSGAEVKLPDTQYFCRLGGLQPKPWFPLLSPANPDGFAMLMAHLRPDARGAVSLASADSNAPPRILNNFLATERDRRILRDGVRRLRDLARQPSMAALAGEEVLPGTEIETDDEIDAYVRQYLGTVFHPCATARMGADDTAVVDPQLNVRGIDRLRVVDASVMPDIVGGNINAVVFMIAEKAADMIRGKTPLQS